MEADAQTLREYFDFAALVGVMRAKQRRYAERKTEGLRQECKRLEAQVDAAVRRARQYEQPKLFEDTPDDAASPH